MLDVVLMASAILVNVSVQEQLDGTEIGDAVQYIAFSSGGGYQAKREDPKKGNTVAKGTWSVDGEKLDVKISSCKGPACGELGKSYQAELQIVAERAMTVKSTWDKGPLSSGSYYCRFQGCEKRTGVAILASGASANVMRFLVDFLAEKNRARDVTVVWWGKKLEAAQPKSALTWCQRDPERGKAGAEKVAKDLAELPWLGTLQAQAGEKDCLYDVLLVVGDGVELPAKN